MPRNLLHFYTFVTRSRGAFLESLQEKGINLEIEYNASPYAALTVFLMRLCQQSQTFVS
jgi:hypothetical protein